MNALEIRILRIVMEAMTDGLDQIGKQKTWERMTKGEEKTNPDLDFAEPLKEMEIPRMEFHARLDAACEFSREFKPSADYPELSEDARALESMEVESYLNTEDLLVLGQERIVKNLISPERP